MSEERTTINNVTVVGKEVKIKEWLKAHKKEIAIAVGAAGITSFVFVKYGHRTLPKSPYMSVRFEAGMDRNSFWEDNEEGRKKLMSGHMFMDLKDLKVSDLGNAGKKLQQMFPGLKDDTPLRRVSMDYNFKV